jgi:hypothetical protein
MGTQGYSGVHMDTREYTGVHGGTRGCSEAHSTGRTPCNIERSKIYISIIHLQVASSFTIELEGLLEIRV